MEGPSKRGTKGKIYKEKIDKFDYTNVKVLCGNVWHKQGQKGDDKLESLFTKYMTARGEKLLWYKELFISIKDKPSTEKKKSNSPRQNYKWPIHRQK